MLDQGNLPAQLRNLRDVVAEYDAKVEAVTENIAAFEAAMGAIESNATVGGTYVGSIWGRGSPSVHQHTLERNLLKSAWQHVYKGLNLHKIASAKDRKKFEMAFEDPPPFTLANHDNSHRTQDEPRAHSDHDLRPRRSGKEAVGANCQGKEKNWLSTGLSNGTRGLENSLTMSAAAM